jgi:hypothetical protein
LFGVEITDTAILFLDKLVVFVASPKKISFLKQIEGGKENDSSPKFKFISREKTDANKAFLREAIEALKKSHNVNFIGDSAVVNPCKRFHKQKTTTMCNGTTCISLI